jgi:hypothetical protein
MVEMKAVQTVDQKVGYLADNWVGWKAVLKELLKAGKWVEKTVGNLVDYWVGLMVARKVASSAEKMADHLVV